MTVEGGAAADAQPGPVGSTFSPQSTPAPTVSRDKVRWRESRYC